jgi:cytochrome c-type biogenesis protein CcmH/NrfG
MNARVWVALLVLAVGGYAVLAAMRGWAFLGSGDPVNIALGVAVFAFPVVGGWLVWREIRFGQQSAKLGRTLADEGGLPVDDFPRTPSGRVQVDAAQQWFERERESVELDPQNWRGWYRLGLAYDAARDRRRAREAIRESIRLAELPAGPLGPMAS